MNEKLIKLLKSNVFFYNSLALCLIAVLLQALNVGFCDDERLNRLIIDLLPRFFACLFLLSASLSLEIEWFDGKIYKGLLWAAPTFLVVIANFPFSALITGAAVVERADLIWLVVLKCLLVAFSEELFFRGIVVKLLSNKISGAHSAFKTVLFSSLIFGAWHLVNIFSGASVPQTLLQVVYTFLIGAMLATAYLRTKNIFICMAVHALFNLGGTLISDVGNGNPQDKIFWILTVLIGVLVGVYILISLLKMDGVEKEAEN